MKFFKSAKGIGIFGIGEINSDSFAVLSAVSLKVILQCDGIQQNTTVILLLNTEWTIC